MSETSFTTGSILGDAFGFASGSFLGVIKVAWFPFVVGYGGLMALMLFMLQPLALAYAGLFGSLGDPAATEAASNALLAAMTEVGFGTIGLAYLVMFVGGLLIYAIPMVAFAKMSAMDYKPRGPLYFKLGPKEIMVAIDYLIIIILASVVGMIIFLVPVGLIAAAAGQNSPVAGLVMIPMIFVLLYVMCGVFARFGLAFPIAAVEGGFGLRRAWGMSRGLGLKITNAIFLSFVIMYVMMMVAFIAFGVLSMPLSMAMGSGDTIGSPMMIVFGVVYALFNVIVYASMLAVSVGLFGRIYQKIKGNTAVAETFE